MIFGQRQFGSETIKKLYFKAHKDYYAKALALSPKVKPEDRQTVDLRLRVAKKTIDRYPNLDE
jgi:hypothetical protein